MEIFCKQLSSNPNIIKNPMHDASHGKPNRSPQIKHTKKLKTIEAHHSSSYIKSSLFIVTNDRWWLKDLNKIKNVLICHVMSSLVKNNMPSFTSR
jgi:hypothetical protein